MTTVSTIIDDAFRASNLTATGAAPTSGEITEALRYLNRIVASTIGNEAGEDFVPVAIGSANISRPTGFPWYETVPDNTDWFVPENTRLFLNIEEALTLYLHPEPDDGARVAVVDMGENLATYNLTLNGNGRHIEGSDTLVLDGSTGNVFEWFYRADTGNWVLYSELSLINEFPFPEEFDDYFIMSLAMRINPQYGKTLDEQALMFWRRAKSQLRARYSVSIPQPVERGLLRMSRMAGDRDRWRTERLAYNPQAAFNKGWPY